MPMPIAKKAAALLIACAAAAALAQTVPEGAAIRVNSVGLVPGLSKKATIKVSALSEDVTFNIRDAATHAIVFTGTTDSPRANHDTGGEFLCVADFTDFNETGDFYVDVPGIGRSAAFSISADAFVDTYRVLMQGMYLWRCGNPGGVSATHTHNGVTNTFSHAICHTGDRAAAVHPIPPGGTKDGSGGWHDAGDYNKYVVNSGVTVGMLLKTWEHFRPVADNTSLLNVSAGTFPAFLTEVKWNLDWVSKMQLADSTVSHKFTARGFGSMTMMPDQETAPRSFTHSTTTATASFVAQMALAYRIYGEFHTETARLYGNQAVRSYEWLTRNPDDNTVSVVDNLIQPTFPTGSYHSRDRRNDLDDRLWAAAEMWEATGQARYLQDFETRAAAMGGDIITIYFDWGSVQNLGAITYLLSELPGKNQVLEETIRGNVIEKANTLVANANTNMHGRTFGSVYYWGTNGVVARNSLLLYAAYRLTGDRVYIHAIQDAMSYLLGRNYYGRSFVTGHGHNPPVYPHCRRSTGSGKTWPGYLLGGPHNKQNHNDAPAHLKCTHHEVCWFDDKDDYWTAEIAINWNSAMIYAAAALMPESPAVSVNDDRRQPPRRGVSHSSSVKTTRIVVGTNGASRHVIPYGAKIYTLNGRLVAERKAGAPAPRIKRSGVYIMRVETK